ncbi:hypothetical protein RRG08_009677 [Elysia crispata]|uniref:PiggyBac transposable element-derived protein domain-containing protein n=1 Tax=Elysia crispata TaxID=231223 RepID=A0AAE1DYX0_9GAST|nr:hypothetical protein RRG08_009677 [Elysia crispata]
MEPTPGPSRSARRISAEEASQRMLQWIEADGSDCESDGDSFHSDSSDSDTDNDDRSRSRSRPNKRVKLAPSPAVPVVGKGKGKLGAGRVTNVRPRVDTGESDDEEQKTAVEDPGPGPASDLDECRQVTTGATEHPIRFTPHRSPGVKEGTLNLNRRNFPPQLKQQRLAHLESRYYMSSDDKTLCVAYKGKKAKKEVVLVSTDADVSSDPTKKGTVVPSVIVTYNQNMNGCDKMDQLIGYYGIHNRKSVKWWKKLFFFLFEIAQANAYILHVLTAEANTRKTLLTFKRALLNQLTSERQENTAAEPQTPATQQKPVTAVPSARLNDTRHIIVAHKNDLRCVHCSKPSAPKRTKFYCSGCPNHPHLHPVCFAPYHSSV